MTAVNNKVFKGCETWLTKERQKFESITEDNFQKFSTEYQQEVDWLRNYLQNIIRATKVEFSKKNEISNQVTDNEITRDTTSCRNNVEITTNATQQIKRLATKRTPKSKHEKPEIKSLILAAAAAKREQEKQEKRIIKAKEWEIARQRAKGKNIDLIRKKKADQIQDNGESIIYKRKPEILEQNKIPSNVPNVQLIEQPKQFGKKIHEKSLYTEKQGDQIQDNGENIIYKRKPEILEPNKIPPNVPNVQLIELKQFGEKVHEKSLHTEKQGDQIQDNGENILHKRKPEILEQNKIPSKVPNVQLFEQLQQFGGKNTLLHTEKQDDQIQDNGENILHKRKPEILEQNKIPSNVPNVQLIELKHFGEKIHEKTLNTEKHGELPEIDTDNSSDEEEVRTKHQQQRKDWEQSPELKAALIRQASIDPETIFGKISPLNVDEIFRGREYRIRPRSSSANWSGLDALTEEEELEYKIRMGFL